MPPLPSKPTPLTDAELAHPENAAVASQAEAIKQQRAIVRERLGKLEETKGSVKAAVYAKVRADYAQQLNETLDRLAALKQQLDAETVELTITLQRLAENLAFHREQLEEVRLRHTLGEFDAATFKEGEARESGEIARLEEAQARLAALRDRYAALFAGEGLPEAAPKAAPAAEPDTATATQFPPAEVTQKRPPVEEAELSGDYFGAPPPPPPEAPPLKAKVAPPQPPPPARAATAGKKAAEAPKQELRFQLLVQERGETVQTLIADRTLVFGRSPSCDIVLKEGKVSRRHAELQFVAGRAVLVDLDSSNGTFVNDDKIHEQEIHDGDTIRIGSYQIMAKTLK